MAFGCSLFILFFQSRFQIAIGRKLFAFFFIVAFFNVVTLFGQYSLYSSKSTCALSRALFAQLDFDIFFNEVFEPECERKRIGGFQAAVPKFAKLQMSPASASVIPPNNAGAVTQVMRISNSLFGQVFFSILFFFCF